MYKHPGVYIEHVPSGVLAIESASTSIAAFIGPVPRGPVNQPVLILNRGQFARDFGELDDDTSGIRDSGDLPDHFGLVVNAFYDNGGRQAYIVRVAKGDAVKARGALGDPAAPGAKGLFLIAASEGAWGNKLVARLGPMDRPKDAAVAADLTLGYLLELGFIAAEQNPDGTDKFIVLESFASVSTDPASGRYLPKILLERSTLVNCEHLALGPAPGGPQVRALRSGDLRTLVINDLKGGVLDITVNGRITKVTIADNLRTFDVIYDTAGVNETKSHTTAAAIANLADLAAGLTTAMRLHDPMKSLAVYVSDDAQLVLVPPARSDGVASEFTAVGGTLGATLVLGAGSTLISYPAIGEARFFSGADGGAVGATDYDDAFAALRDYRDASIILTPGAVYDSHGKDIIDKAITHAEFMLNRVVIVDPKDTSVLSNRLTTGKEVKDAGLPASTFSAFYYPWMEVANPHYDPDTRANVPRTLLIPPSGFAAGMWARIDGSRGVWKAPAGLETGVRGTRGPNILIGNDLQDQLNEWGVNCIRSIIGPPVIWGARTLATKVQPDQRYVPVRRTSILIGESLYNALQAVVFEPNTHTLWASLRASASDFMDGLFRAGAFQGEKASEAYYVLCGLNSTMTQGDIDAGIVRLVVGYAPLKPAEFVVVQIKQIVGQRG